MSTETNADATNTASAEDTQVERRKKLVALAKKIKGKKEYVLADVILESLSNESVSAPSAHHIILKSLKLAADAFDAEKTFQYVEWFIEAHDAVSYCSPDLLLPLEATPNLHEFRDCIDRLLNRIIVRCLAPQDPADGLCESTFTGLMRWLVLKGEENDVRHANLVSIEQVNQLGHLLRLAAGSMPTLLQTGDYKRIHRAFVERMCHALVRLSSTDRLSHWIYLTEAMPVEEVAVFEALEQQAERLTSLWNAAEVLAKSCINHVRGEKLPGVTINDRHEITFARDLNYVTILITGITPKQITRDKVASMIVNFVKGRSEEVNFFVQRNIAVSLDFHCDCND